MKKIIQTVILLCILSIGCQARNFTILGLGDSITEGIDGQGSYLSPLKRMLFEEGYDVEFIGPRMSRCGDEAIPCYGWCGKDVEFIESTIEDVYRKYPADIVLFHAGHNHDAATRPVKGIIKAYRSVIRKIRMINPDVVILVAEVIPSGKLPKYSYIPGLNREIARLVSGYDDDKIRLVNIAENYNWRRLNVSDMVHPNAEGREWIAGCWNEALKDLLGEPVFTPLKMTCFNLVPSEASNAPNYYCTWNTQYAYCGNDDIRAEMTEDNIFGDGPGQGWINFYQKIRKDLYFLLDDSWDIPVNANKGYGRDEVDTTRFPSITGNALERMTKLSDKVKAKGWKGLGLWVAANEDPDTGMTAEEFWADRLSTFGKAGVGYLKVDWGKQEHNAEYRRNMTALGKKNAPGLWIEHAPCIGPTPTENLRPYVTFSDVYRTYDVDDVISVPLTIDRVARMLSLKAEEGVKGLVNCEDEVYIAAGLGCTIGIMRHPFLNVSGNDLNTVSKIKYRDIFIRLDEVARAVRWSRIAEPFGVNSDVRIDSNRFTDRWIYGKGESWVKHEIGDTVKASAPARVSRNMPVAETDDISDECPYLLCSRYPDGATAVSALPRRIGRERIAKAVDVSIEIDDIYKPIGVFGVFGSLTLKTDGIKGKMFRVLAQDLAGDKAVDISKSVTISNNGIIIPGEVLNRIGTMAATPGDISAPGTVIRIYDAAGRWTEEQANEWGNTHPWYSGVNYIPSNAVNQIEMWSADTFDIDRIDEELGWAEDLGFNTLRVFLSSVVWQNDPCGLKERMSTFLNVCRNHGIRPMFVFFDDCWEAESAYGKQPAPKTGIHNSGWVRDPSMSVRKDEDSLYELVESYMSDIFTTFGRDDRILMWDLFNEPGGNQLVTQSLPLVKKVFEIARKCLPSQPLTCGIWMLDKAYAPLNAFQLQNSDVISYHCYAPEDVHAAEIKHLEVFNRPMFCTEYMARTKGSTFSSIMPLLKKKKVGAINWGLVEGKTNTKYSWEEPHPDGSEPTLWFHDILHTDGTPYKTEEIEVIKKLNNRK
ncbi:MAG: GDSL-type esterase/lipase family protein [Bacteroidales bacterium]|nr:GDSL-type esterase/lipase family protein [Bacteroidales bacterium]